MRRVLLLVAVAGCRQIFGLDDPRMTSPDAAIDALEFFDAPCADRDNDGICDDIDDWQCGPIKPDPLPAMHDFAPAVNVDAMLTNIAISYAALNVPGSTLVNIPASALLKIDTHLVFHDTSCAAGCIDQLEVGFAPMNHRAGCIFDGLVDKTNGTTSDLDVETIAAPMTPGAYELRGHIGQDTKCTGTTDWFDGVPPTAADTFAMICVY